MIKLKVHNENIYIIGIYRPKESLIEAMEVISSVLDKIPTWKNPVILIGDINIDCLKQDRDEVLLNETLLSYNMGRIPLPPTRITPYSKTSIDCVCTNLEKCQVTVDILHAGISDHTAQLCRLNINTERAKTIIGRKRNFSEDNVKDFKNSLASVVWDDALSSSDIDVAYDNFSKIIKHILDNSCPFQANKLRKKKKLWNGESEKLRREFLKSNDLYLLTGLKEHKDQAAICKRNYDLKLKELRREAAANQIAHSNNKTKAIWGIINKERKTTGTEGPKELRINNDTTTNPNRIADHLNIFFTTMAEAAIVSNTIEAKIEQNSAIQSNIPNFHLQPANVKEVIKAIDALSVKVSSGVDEISSKLLKACKEELAYPVTRLINTSFQCGKFPRQLKLARVIPIFKHGEKTAAENYRPISLISTFSKVFEKIVLSRLMDHLSQHNLLTTQQHGFTKNKSTSTALISFIEYIIDQIEHNNTTTAILLDFSKAFDTLDHKQLLAKMSSLGVRNKAADWFNSYLTNRQQVVEIKHIEDHVVKHTRSKHMPVLRGVPQGSVLGPVLFTLFTNDLPKYVEEYATALMYADDTALLLAEKHPEDLEIQSYVALNMAVQYSQSNSLLINKDKTQQLVIGRKKEQVSYLPGIEIATAAKYLGVTIDENLNWTPHIDNLCRKLSTGVYIIKRLMKISDPATAKIAYFALFEAHLRYGLLVWGKSSANNLQRILVIQKKAVRALENLQPRQSCRPSFTKLSILTVASLYVLEAVVFAQKSNLPRGNTVHHHNTRHAANFQLPVHRMALFEEKPSYMGLKLWNHLPEDLKKGNTRTFKNDVKKWLLLNPFYTIEEYLRRKD